jgi:hypothetical protein
VRAEVLLPAAVANNAGWCDAVCRSHGYPGELTARVWISPGHDLPFYPNAITMSRQATAADTGRPGTLTGLTASRTASRAWT